MRHKNSTWKDDEDLWRRKEANQVSRTIASEKAFEISIKEIFQMIFKIPNVQSLERKRVYIWKYSKYESSKDKKIRVWKTL